MLKIPENKVVVSLCLQSKIMEFYHDNLWHTGSNKPLHTISNNLYLPSLWQYTKFYSSKCDICDHLKENASSRCEQLILKDTDQESTPWDIVIIDSTGSWIFSDHAGKEMMLIAHTIIEPSTELFELFRTKSTSSLEVSRFFHVN